MPCYFGYDAKSGMQFHICGDLGPHCAECADVGVNLCDYPVGDNKTCDRTLCENHSNDIAPNMHYCKAHFIMFCEFIHSGADIESLKNVEPFFTALNTNEAKIRDFCNAKGSRRPINEVINAFIHEYRYGVEMRRQKIKEFLFTLFAGGAQK